MATIFKIVCAECGEAGVTKGTGSKAHAVHVSVMRGAKEAHPFVIKSIKVAEGV